MPRPISVAGVTLTIVLYRSLAFACSMVAGYTVEPGDGVGWSTANAEMRYWHAYDRVVSLEVTDLKGRRVEGRVVVTPIPSVAQRSLPIYDGKSFFTTFQPLQPIDPGPYEIRVHRSRYRVTIRATTDRTGPAAVVNARARLLTMVTMVGYEANCQSIYEPRQFLELSVDSPGEEGLLYEVNWSAAVAATRGLRSEPGSDGRQVIRIPVGWFGDVSTNWSPAAVELRAVDKPGNSSPPRRIRVPPLPPRPPREGGPVPEQPTPIPRQQAIDLTRFARVAASDDARDALGLLAAIEPSPADSQYDAEFKRHILSRDQLVSVFATVRGGEGRASLVVPVRIQGGRAAPVLSAAELRLLIAAFPLDNPTVTNVELSVWPDRHVEILSSGRKLWDRYVWRPDDDRIGWAAEHGALSFVREWAEGGGHLEGRAGADSPDRTPLMRAARRGQTAVVKFLLERGANVNAQTKQGGTALYEAAHAGHVEAMRLLLDAGADPNLPQLDWPPLRHAAFEGRTEAALLLLSRGVSPNMKVDNAGQTALMTAAGQGHVNTVVALLDNGADVNARSDYGDTALISATCRPEMVEILLDRGADVSPRGMNGRTALSNAIMCGSLQAVEQLIEAKADVNAIGWNGNVPLAQARNHSDMRVSQKIVELLIAAGAKEP